MIRAPKLYFRTKISNKIVSYENAVVIVKDGYGVNGQKEAPLRDVFTSDVRELSATWRCFGAIVPRLIQTVGISLGTKSCKISFLFISIESYFKINMSSKFLTK